MTNPRVSVITGFYNRAHVLARTLDSILAQTSPDFELIVFDDCSTDDTAERLLAYAAKDARIKPIIHETNKGFVRGLVEAIAVAKGQYIAIQGSGDASLPRRLELQARMLDEDPGAVVVGCHYENVFEDSGLRRLRRPDADSVTLASLLKANVFSHGEVMFRRSAYDQTDGYRTEFRFAQDRDLWVRMIRLGHFRTVKELLYQRYILLDGVSYKPEKAVVQARYSILACRLASQTPEQVAEALAVLRTSGPLTLVSKSDPALQKYVFKALARSLIWGDRDSAEKFSKELGNPALQTFATGLVTLLGSRSGRQSLGLIRRALGLSGSPA